MSKVTYSQYDDIAEIYDTLFVDKESLDENHEVGNMFQPRGRTLDVGCGTGLLVEIKNIPSSDYVGIDPSRKMLARFRGKHPEYKVICRPFTESEDLTPYETIVSLFGAASYLTKESLVSLANSPAALFLMLYSDSYYPVTYSKCNVAFKDNVRQAESDLTAKRPEYYMFTCSKCGGLIKVKKNG